jgi:hypothetical protein
MIGLKFASDNARRTWMGFLAGTLLIFSMVAWVTFSVEYARWYATNPASDETMPDSVTAWLVTAAISNVVVFALARYRGTLEPKKQAA